MNKYQEYKRTMNSRIKKCSDETLKLMWDDWHCEHDLFKRSFNELGISRQDRINLSNAMMVLNIEEALNLSGINHRVYPAFFSEETKSMFATMQSKIATKKEYRIYE